MHFVTFISLNTTEFILFLLGNGYCFYGALVNEHFINMILVIIVYGYIMMTLYILSVVAIIFLLCGLKAYGLFNRKGEKSYEEMINKDARQKSDNTNLDGKQTGDFYQEIPDDQRWKLVAQKKDCEACFINLKLEDRIVQSCILYIS